MSANRILVLGTNAGQADLIRHMKSLGWSVHACAHRAGGAGERLVDAFHLIDIKSVESVSKLARQIAPDLIYSVSSDIAMGTAIAVSERMGLPHFYDSDFFELLAQKPLLREFLNQRGLSDVPFRRLKSVNDAEGWDTFPCMVKPSDSQGQRGVVRVDDARALRKAVEDAIEMSVDSGSAIVEAFLDGVEVSCNTLVRDGQIVFDVLSERLVHEGDNIGIPRGHLIPCVNLTQAEQTQAMNLVRAILEAFGMRDGCLYFQMIITPAGPKVVEIAPRLDGCHMWRLIEAATGENFLAATVETLIARVRSIESKVSLHSSKNYELMFQQAPPGMNFSRDAFSRPIGSIHHELRYEDGEPILPINGRLEVVGYYVRESNPRAHVQPREQAR